MYRNILGSLNDWNIITLATQTNNSEKNNEAFKTILRGFETRMSEKILTTMYGAMRPDDEITDGYYVVQWTSEPYTLQEDKDINCYIPSVTAYAGEDICDAVFLNPVNSAKYWLTPMNKRDGGIAVRLKQVLLSNITMMKIDKNNKLPKRYNTK